MRVGIYPEGTDMNQSAFVCVYMYFYLEKSHQIEVS